MTREFPLLEILRVVAASAVIIYHWKHFFLPAGVSNPSPDDLSRFPAADFLESLYVHGGAGVQVFWVISGFIIAWKYADAVAARRIGIGEFLTLRFSRLYPLHVLTLLAVGGLQALHQARTGGYFVNTDHSPAAFIAHLLFMSGWNSAWMASFNHPVWSVSVEIAVYAAFFLWVARFGFSARQALNFLGLTLLARLAVGQHNMVLCAVFFALGMLLYRLRGRLPAARESRARLLLMAAAICGGWLMSRSSGKLYVVAEMLMSVGLVGACVSANRACLTNSVRSACAYLGNLTYASYLLHFPLQIVVVLAVDATSASPALYQSGLFLFAFYAVVMVLSRVAFLTVELPAQAFLRRTLLPRGVAARRGAG